MFCLKEVPYILIRESRFLNSSRLEGEGLYTGKKAQGGEVNRQENR